MTCLSLHSYYVAEKEANPPWAASRAPEPVLLGTLPSVAVANSGPAWAGVSSPETSRTVGAGGKLQSSTSQIGGRCRRRTTGVGGDEGRVCL